MMNLLMMILNYGGHVKPLYTRCASHKGGLVRLQGAPPRCLCHTLTELTFASKRRFKHAYCQTVNYNSLSIGRTLSYHDAKILDEGIEVGEVQGLRFKGFCLEQRI